MSIADVEAKVPRPRERTLGSGGGGGGPMIASRGSESDFGDTERCLEVLAQLLRAAELRSERLHLDWGREAEDEADEARRFRRERR